MLYEKIGNNISRKIYFLYLLNVVDFICTTVLLSSGYFTEANPIAASFIYNLPLGLIIKCVIPFIAVAFVSSQLHLLNDRNLKLADNFISFGIALYVFANLTHIVNYILLFIYT